MASLPKIVELCKRRGWIYPPMGGIEAYVQGIRGLYDYGPLGVLLKRNMIEEWFRDMVVKKRLNLHQTSGGRGCKSYIDILPLETSLVGSRRMYEASGHVEKFVDPLMDDYVSKERFRSDTATGVHLEEEEDGCKVIKIDAGDSDTAKLWKMMIDQRLAPGAKTVLKAQQVWLYVDTLIEPQNDTTPGEIVFCPLDEGQDGIRVMYRGVASPSNNSPFVTPSRPFNLMFQTFWGAVNPILSTVSYLLDHRDKPRQELEQLLQQRLREHMAYLRPETAQGTYLQSIPCMEAYGLSIPFGLVQVGRSFRNEVSPEHFIFRTTEFEQMELQFFVHPGSEAYWFDYWRRERMAWWKRFFNHPEHLLERTHAQDKLAHYAKACVDIEYRFPFGFGEIEGIASRTDFDLRQHAMASGSRLDVMGAEPGGRFYPFVIEPAAGLNRGMLAILCDAFTEEERPGSQVRTVLKLHPRLAPYKVAVLPLIRKDRLVHQARSIADLLWKQDWQVSYDEKHTIGKRYARHDEIGTPYCITVDFQTLEDGTVTLRHRDTAEQERIHTQEIGHLLKERIFRD